MRSKLPRDGKAGMEDDNETTEPKCVDLVLSGGGVKFIGLVGAIVALMDAG